MYAKIKSNLGRILPGQRYADPSDAQTPDEQIDPETWHHDAKPGLGERLARSKRTLAMYGLFIAVSVAILFIWSRQFIVGVATNPATRTVGTHLAVFIMGLVMGIKSFRGRLQEWDWLVLQLPDGTMPLLGELEQADDGTTIFIPYSGIDWLGFKARQLKLGELGSSIARTLAKQGRDMESGARIRVDDAVMASRDTAYGTVTAVMTAGLEIDPFGQHSDVYTAPPNTVNAEQYKQLRDRLRDYVEDELPRLQSENSYLKQQKNDLRARLHQTDDDAIEQFIDRYSRVERSRQEAINGVDDEDDSDILEDMAEDEALANGGGV